MVEIWTYIASEASEGVATHFVTGFEKHFENVQHFPGLGAERFHLAAGLRVTFYQRYAIYYLHSGSEVLIVRVLHGARDSAALADQGGFSA